MCPGQPAIRYVRVPTSFRANGGVRCTPHPRQSSPDAVARALRRVAPAWPQHWPQTRPNVGQVGWKARSSATDRRAAPPAEAKQHLHDSVTHPVPVTRSLARQRGDPPPRCASTTGGSATRWWWSPTLRRQQRNGSATAVVVTNLGVADNGSLDRTVDGLVELVARDHVGQGEPN